jgi:hypothetical protein
LQSLCEVTLGRRSVFLDQQQEVRAGGRQTPSLQSRPSISAEQRHELEYTPQAILTLMVGTNFCQVRDSTT